MVKNKYIKPIVELAHRQEERSHHVYTGRRRARDFELSRYGTQIRQIQNHSTNYYSIDNIVEALLLANGDSRQAYDILMREDDHGNNYHAAGAATATARLENAPQLPTRPSNVIKPAVFDGTNVITSSPYAQGTNVSNLTEPRPAVFDGTMDLSQSGVVNPQFQQSNVNQYGMMQPGIQQGIQQGIQPMMTQNTAPLPQQPMIQPMLTQNTAPVPQQPMLTQNTAPVPQQPMMTQNTAPQQYMFQQNQQTSQQYPYSQTYMMPNYPQ